MYLQKTKEVAETAPLKSCWQQIIVKITSEFYHKNYCGIQDNWFKTGTMAY